MWLISRSRGKIYPPDLFLPPSERAGVCLFDKVLRLGLIQPFLKIDLQGPEGKLSEHRIEQMLALLLHLIGVDMEDTEAAVDLIFDK